jgi:hypothetical protein
MSSPTLQITGFGVAYPPNLVSTADLEKLAYKWHEPSPACVGYFLCWMLY